MRIDCPEERAAIGNAGMASSNHTNYEADALLLHCMFPLVSREDLADFKPDVDDRQLEMEMS